MATKRSLRQQLETALLAWLNASFSGATEFSGVTFSAGQTDSEVALPLVTVVCDEAQEQEVPGAGIFRATAAFVLLTSFDETNGAAAHRERADILANKTEDHDGLRSWLNASGRVHVFGLGLARSRHEVQDRHFVDRLEVELHLRCT